ncbi:hypothetical protein BDW66DRAFT_148483 [Aspergillus desertorum]
MAPSLVTIDSSEPLEEVYKIIERDGGVIVSNFLPPKLLKECMNASECRKLPSSVRSNKNLLARPVEPFFKGRKIYDSKATHEELGPDFFPEGSQRVYALLSKIPDQLIKIMRLPVWQGIMGRFLKYKTTDQNDQLNLAPYIAAKATPEPLFWGSTHNTPIEIARRLPEDILKLAGYYKAVGGVGYVEDHQSPYEFLQRDDFGAGKFGVASLAV